MFDIYKFILTGLRCGEETMLSHFDRIPERDRQTDGQTELILNSLIYLSCLHCFFVTVLYDSRLLMCNCNIKVVCVKSLSVFATMLLCEEIM